MKTIKVLHCIYSFAGGGAERQLGLLCGHSQEHALDQYTFFVDDAGASLDKKRKLIQHKRKNKIDFSIFSAIANTIDEVKPDIIHAWLPPFIVIPTIIVGWWKKVPVIISYRNSEKIRGLLSFLEYMFAWMFAKGVTSNTNPDLCSLLHQKLFSRKNGILIRNAVTIPDAYKNIDKQKRNKDSRLSILYVGRITAQKNWKCLLNALKALNDNISWSLTVCGKGDEEVFFNNTISNLGLNSNITLLGYRSDVYKIMFESDVLVLPSLYEGMSNVLVEAFALGLPAVISDIPAHRDLLGSSEAAIIFPPDSPNILAEILESFSDNHELLEKLSMKGKVVTEYYTVTKMVSSYSDYYKFVLETK